MYVLLIVVEQGHLPQLLINSQCGYWQSFLCLFVCNKGVTDWGLGIF
jgi:hypothetical protein